MALNVAISTTSILDAARALCVSRGARFTPQRQRVFELLLDALPHAITAYELLERLQREDPAAKPPTVYRALAFLQEQGLVHRVDSSNAFLACHHPGDAHAVQLLICDDCGTVQELHSEQLRQDLEQQARQAGFAIRHETIEAHGRCRGCR